MKDSEVSADVKASLAEMDLNFVDKVDVGVGVNVNTGFGIGAQQTGVKVLGNGLYVGTKGIDVSVLGVNLRFKFW